jgi:hypothetical protein
VRLGVLTDVLWLLLGEQTDMDSVPLFEREHRNDSQLVQRLQSELADAKRFVEAQARRQNDLEYVNEDLERRCVSVGAVGTSGLGLRG